MTKKKIQNLLKNFMERLPEMDDPDCPLEGSKCVEVVADYWEDFRRAIK